MFVISLGGMSELVLLGLVVRAEAVLHAQAERLSQRLIVGWNPEYCQYRQGARPGAGRGWISAHPITCDLAIYQQLSSIVSGD
jgi:hypothetical protein